MLTELEFRQQFAEYLAEQHHDPNRPQDCPIDPDDEWESMLSLVIEDGEFPATMQYLPRVLNCWQCRANLACYDLYCPECDTDCRFACENCGQMHTPAEPGCGAWVETPDEFLGMLSVCHYCENTLPKHPEEGWVLFPTNILARTEE